MKKKNITDKEFLEAVRRVVRWAETKRATSSYAAAAYAYATNIGRAGILYGRQAISTQIAYIIVNLNGFRGEEAKKIKATLKQFKAQLEKEVKNGKGK